MNLLERVRDYWDADAATYDDSASHAVKTPTERAAWAAALRRCLPEPPARVLDAGAGTGFLTLPLARQGHEVTALDLSERMLARLRDKATDEGLDPRIVHGPAGEPPEGPFDAVVERHLLWQLPDPAAALRAWRKAAPAGRLVLVESLWGEADRGQTRWARLRDLWRRLRRVPSAHHAGLGELRERLPLGRGASPDRLIGLLEAGGWANPRLTRLTDVEWARLHALPPHQRLLGTTPRYVIVAD